MYSKNGIGGVVATALLLVVTVSAAVAFQTWFSTYSSNVFTTIEQDGSTESLKTGIERVVGNKLYLNNGENSNLSIDKVEIDGVDCGINSTLTNGVTSIDISSCVENISTSVADVVVYTDKKIFSKSQTFDDSSINQEGNQDLGPVDFSKDSFITEWNTSADGNTSNSSIRLPLEEGGTYNFFVDWGDGTNNTITSWDQAEKTHTYNSSGVYTVNITGTLQGFGFGEGFSGWPKYTYFDDAPKLLDIQQWGDVILSNSGKQFYLSGNLQITANDAPNLSSITNMSSMFEGAFSFNDSINNWEVSSVEDMSSIFEGASSFNQPLNDWNTSSVKDMSSMFDGSDFNQPLDSWNTSSVINMGGMFYYATSFNQPINSWDTSNVQNMTRMFNNADSFNQSLNNWTTSNVTTMSEIFRGTDSFNQPLNDWDTSSVTDMTSMFSSADSFNQPLNEWDTSSVKDMRVMFRTASSFNQPLDKWNVSNVTTMNFMFWDATSFNQSLNNWSVGAVENMSGMFINTDSFNQPLNDWDVSNVKIMEEMFYQASNFNQPLNNWNTSSVEDMNDMFEDANSFDQSLNDWDTSSVINMSGMFADADPFNQPLNNWNTSNVEDMGGMFFRTNSFNQNISTWCVEKISDKPVNFDYSSGFEGQTSLQPQWGSCP